VLNKVGPFEGVFRFLPRRREDLIRGILGSAVEFEFEVTSVSLSKIVWEWVPATRIDMVDTGQNVKMGKMMKIVEKPEIWVVFRKSVIF